MKRLAMAAACTLVAFSAFGQEDVNADRDLQGQWRLAASAAFSDYDGETTGVDDSTVGFKLSAQYQFNELFGVEGAYLNTSDFESPQVAGGTSSGTNEVVFRGFSIAGVGYLPLAGDDFDVYGLLGYFDFDTDLSIDSVVASSGHTDGLFVGAGATIRISEQMGVKAEIDWYDVDNADLWAAILGLEYRF
jgi:opacity protein-like surface antigen